MCPGCKSGYLAGIAARRSVDLRVVDGKLRVHLASDDNATTVLTYEADL